MTDYKSTINLPQTEFPMQANLAKREPEMLARWLKEDLYGAVQAASQGRPVFWLVDGPPYANGDIHIGHAVNKVLKDIVVKAARLDGYHAPFTPGWDCHGLPIELQVEKKFGKVGERLDARTFREKCREYAAEQIARQREDFKRLGVLADWDRPYLTMHPAFEAEQLRALAQIIENGHVVRGFKPVHWCLDCASSLAEAEVEYQDKVSHSIDVRFLAADAGELARRFGVAEADGAAFVIWTTTPWTLPANQAIAVGPHITYVLAEFPRAGRLVVAADLLEPLARRLGQVARVLGSATGAALEGMRAHHPFASREVPVILGEHVTLDAGTGLVHTAPAHGQEDYVVGLRYRLPVDNPVGSDGVFVEGTPVVAGHHVRKADALILDVLKARDALLAHDSITHSYPHCWRHKTPLIFRATPQWFVSMDANGLREKAVRAIGQTQWIPDWGESRIREMVAGRPDWCISRQRYWGVPLALFVDRKTQDMHPQTAELLRRIADRVEREGLEVWFGSTPEDWGVDSARYEKCTDTLDVWFDSGVVHQCAFRSVIPDALVDGVAPQADIYLEGSDQHRGWFQSSLLTSVAMRDRAPYKSVLTHGFTVDEQGRKMSKSLGNVVSPQQVTKTLGADVLRLWVAASDYSGEIAISDKLLARMADAYRRIRNTARFLLGNLDGFDPIHDRVPPERLVAVDAWAIAEAAKLQDELRAAYARREFHVVYHKLHNYCVVDLGGRYLDLLKDRLYTTPRKSLARRSAQTALLHIAEALVRWIAPILSFTADEIWRLLPGDRSAPLFAQRWHAFPQVAPDALDWPLLCALREGVKKVLEDLRVAGQIGSGLNAEVTLYADDAQAEALRKVGAELRFWFITSDVEIAPVAARSAEALEVKHGDASIWVAARVSPHPKCERCWHQRSDVGRDVRHPSLCGRCIENIDGPGETRRYF
ncbi:isoleucine--tRNA ligase [Fontimonas thermophila]|uniref:isoleucine--tRNA ligase n=1 Tax=Fontimonas thermophila TaxID=1076937 RepID=UPI000ACF475C|nr:isoleucine--tRNA ligase [Fontimonas thermophila]